jgi:hypothetical protein
MTANIKLVTLVNKKIKILTETPSEKIKALKDSLLKINKKFRSQSKRNRQ